MITTPVELNLDVLKLTDEQFYQICKNNPNFRLETSSKGDLIIMSPTGDETSNRNAGIIAQLWLWNHQNKLGIVFDSSAGFKLPNQAIVSPDASWIPLAKWQQIPPQDREKFSQICPDFVIELLSPTHNLKTTQIKMQQYIENGSLLGWLINRKTQQVEIYRPDQEVEILTHPQTLSGENILPGFVLEMAMIW